MKKLVCILLSVCLFLSLFVGLAFAEEAKTDEDIMCWSGEYDSDLALDSDGNYLITSAEELAYVVSTFGLDSSGKALSFKLTKDIYLNDIEKIDWSTGLVKKGYNITPNTWFVGDTKNCSTYLADGTAGIFKGTLDGNGYTVHGLWYSPDMTDTAAGLIPSVNGTVKNLTISNSYVVGGVYTGAVSSYFAGTLSNIFVDDTVTVVGKKNVTASSYALGGLVGWSAGINITDCGFTGTLENHGTGHVYGFIGTSWNTQITARGGYSFGYQPFTTSSAVLNAASAEAAENTFKNRYVVTDVYTDTHFKNNNTSYKLDTNGDGSYTDETALTISDVIVFSELSSDKMTGKTALENMPALWGEVWYATSDTPLLRIWGAAHGDVDEDIFAPTKNDLLSLRATLIGSENYLNTDFNRDGDTDICDLVAMANYRNTLNQNTCKHIYETETITESTATLHGTAKYTCTICEHSYIGELPTEIKILAVGNSFSVDGMHYLWNILTDAGVEKVTLGNLYIAGCSLDTHWANMSEDKAAYDYFKNTDGTWQGSFYNYDTKVSTALADEDWDFITVQQSSAGSGRPTTYTNFENVLNYVNENKPSENTKLFWHMTWAYANSSASSAFGSYGRDQMTMYEAITETVQSTVLPNDLIDGVIPTGTAIQNVRTSYLGDTLNRDGSHLSYDYGCYTAGLTWMTALTGITPDKVDWVPPSYGFIANDNAMIDEAVTAAINNPYEVTPSAHTTRPTPEELKILAIGNSFSVDGMEYLWNILTDAGVEKVTLGNLYIGGCSVGTHWRNVSENKAAYTYYKNTTGNWSSTPDTAIETALLEEEWDIITVQQASPYSGQPATYAELPNLLNYIETNKTNKDAKIFWHMTWAYQQDHKEEYFDNYNCDQMTMYKAIVNAVKSKAITEDLIDGMIPTGTTIQNMRTSYLGDTLTRDTSHLSYDFGRYAAGLTWLKAITGIAPEAVDWVPSSYPTLSSHRDMINQAVNSAVKTPFAVTASTYSEAPETPEEPEEPEVTVDPDAALMESNGLDINDFELLNLEPTIGAYYNSKSGINIITTQSNSPNFIASKLFYKTNLPVGSVIILDSGYGYRPEGWIDASTKNSARPAAVTSNFTKVDETWWGDYTIRGFNLYSTSSTVMTAADAAALRIYVPKAKPEGVAEADVALFEAKGLNSENYIALDWKPTIGAYYNSNGLTSLHTSDSIAPKFIASKLLYKEDLPVGSVIILDSGYKYRPEGWIDSSTKNTTRPGSVTANFVVTDEAWWGNYTIRGFNLCSTTSDTVMTEADASALRIYIPIS